MRTIFIDNFGWDAVTVTIEGEPVLFMDADLSWDRRMDLMLEALADVS